MIRYIFLLTLLITAIFGCRASETSVIPADGAAETADTISDSGCADMLGDHLVTRPVAPDSADVALLSHKAFWRASAETVGMNLGLWAFDRYIQKGAFAYISWETIKENFRHGFEWDNDHLSTNMFAHPYNGSIFYNAGRSNGFNYWQSTLFAIGGSAMWEMFMEKEYPSTNDIIATPIGGAALGEVFYRTSDILLDDRSRGGERFGRELAAFIIDPMRGFTRLVTGRAWRHRATSGRRFGIPEVAIRFSLGARGLSLHSMYSDELIGGLTGRVDIEYGDRFAMTQHSPYDYFSFRLDADIMPEQPVLSRIEIIGRLLTHPLVDTPTTDLNLGLYQHFDFFDSDTITTFHPFVLEGCQVPYKFGTPASIGGGLMYRYLRCGSWRLDSYFHANAVLLGGILSDFYRYYHRNYNWGMGFSIKGGVSWRMPSERVKVSLDARFYRLYTLNGRVEDPDAPPLRPDNIQGDKSNSSFFNLSLQMDYRIWHRIYGTLQLEWLRRYAFYPGRFVPIDSPSFPAYGVGSPIISNNKLSFKLMLTYEM